MKSARINIFNHARLVILCHKFLLQPHTIKMCFVEFKNMYYSNSGSSISSLKSSIKSWFAPTLVTSK